MKDLASCVEIVQHVVEPRVWSPNEWPLTLFEVPVDMSIPLGKKCSKKHLKFWRVVSNAITYFIRGEIREMLWAWLGTRFFELLAVVELFSWVIDTIKTAVDVVEYSAIEASRDPPSIFIPLPKIESTNGCARSDLPIRSLIF
ncbi:hypothetical protein [Microcoleus sp. Pol17_C1]|uniref:hypothetical protein n=1 Tax=unclassified Microcoleus TaxID=2642155 RepID=UPI002FCF7CCD